MHAADSHRRRRTGRYPLSAIAVVVALLALMGGTALAEEPVVPGDDAGVIDPGAVLPDPAPAPEPAPVPVEPVAAPEPAPAPAPTPAPAAAPAPAPAPAPEPAPAPVDPEPVDPTVAAPNAPVAPPTRDPAIAPEPGPASPPLDAAGNPVGTVVGPAPVAVPAPAIELPPPAPTPAPAPDPGPGLIELPGPAVAAATQAKAVIELPTPAPAPAPIALPPAKDVVPHVIAPEPVEFAPIAVEPEPVNPLVAAEASAQLISPDTAESVFGGLVAVAEEATATAAPLAAPVTAFLPDVLPIEDVAPTGLLERLASFVLPVDGSSNAILVALFEVGFALALALSIGRPRPQSSPLRADAERPLFGYRAVVFRPG